jgi:hypothetical protein
MYNITLEKLNTEMQIWQIFFSYLKPIVDYYIFAT